MRRAGSRGAVLLIVFGALAVGGIGAGCRRASAPPVIAGPPEMPSPPETAKPTAASEKTSSAVKAAQPAEPTKTTKLPEEAKGKAREIVWLSSLQEGLQQAKASGKYVLVDFFATWCGPCQQMDEETWPDADVIEAVKAFVPVRLDIDVAKAEAERYKVEAVPTIMILNAAGQEIDRSVGFSEPGELIAWLKSHKKR